MTPSHDDIDTCARRWYGVHSAAYLSRDTDRMIDACGAHLVDRYPISVTRAVDAARLAWADMRHDDAGGYIDIDRSTHAMVVIREQGSGRSHMLTSAELLALVRERHRAASAEDG